MQVTDMPIGQLVENPDNPRKQIGDVADTDSAWDSESGCEDMKAYYQALTVLGYQPSSEETAALDGAHALTKEDRK